MLPRSIALLACGFLLLVAPLARGQAFRSLRINEVIADHRGEGPADVAGGTPDIVEIYNAGEEPVIIGADDERESLGLSDSFSVPDRLWTFRSGTRGEAGRSIVVFCDNNACQDECEPHAGFRIDADGSEPVTLWGPVTGEDDQGRPVREVVDRVWLPPLGPDVSFARFREGEGPAPVPVRETFEHFVFQPPGMSSLGTCRELPTPCCRSAPETLHKRLCRGSRNLGAGNLAPRVRRAEHSTNSPGPGEVVEFTVEARDDQEPTPPNIAKVEIRYRVDTGTGSGFGPVQTVAMAYDEVSGVKPDLTGLEPCDPLDMGCDFPKRPLDRRTLWTGAIPPQPRDSRVEFHFFVEDREGLSSTSPAPLCEELFADVHGPCDRRFGGLFGGETNCRRDPDDETCGGGEADGGGVPRPPLEGERYIACDAWFTYAVGYEPRGDLRAVVINEVVPLQETVLADETQRDCDTRDQCAPELPDCCQRREDFIELHNSGAVAVDLSGLWLADSYFKPRGWQFPPDSRLDPGDYLIVWIDNDGGKCPDPQRVDPPCFWECPDPTDSAATEYHTNFALEFAGDQIFLYDTAENDFGLIHGLDFSRDFSLSVEDVDKSLSLLPDGDRQGCFVLVDEPTPRQPNVGECTDERLPFLRGDATGDCGVDLSDAVFTLNWLFLGGRAPGCADAADSDDNGVVAITDAVRTLNYLFRGGPPPADPGPMTAAVDPTPDDLPACVSPDCG
ncbi:MAG: lamin tail domain-containing protein [Planctomycetota bacterium]|nr:lamin tail domain-containing protein [Planctomycetota bacterium]